MVETYENLRKIDVLVVEMYENQTKINVLTMET